VGDGPGGPDHTISFPAIGTQEYAFLEAGSLEQ